MLPRLAWINSDNAIESNSTQQARLGDLELDSMELSKLIRARRGSKSVLKNLEFKLEKGLMTRSLVPLCGGREDTLLEKSV